MQEIILKNPLDMHLHIREADILKTALPFSSRSFVGGVIMPNLKIPVTTAKLAQAYEEQINLIEPDFMPLMTIYITDQLNEQELLDIKKSGYKILKLYPKGATTNSSNGVSEILNPIMMKNLKIAEELGLFLSIHGESNGFSLDREYEFLKVFETLCQHFPKLKIFIEHISDRRSIKALESFENLYGTLTLHHITLDLDALLGKGLNPHHFCKPILKTPQDREALLELALNAHPKISFGSDSAPHSQSAKLSNNAPGGIFSAPYLLENLVELFSHHHKLTNLQNFISDNAIRNYQLTIKKDKIIRFKKAPTIIPKSILINNQNDYLIPFCANKTISYSQID